MANCQVLKKSEATVEQDDGAGATEIAQDLESLRELAARFRRLAPTAQEHLLRAILGKREALLEAISERLGALAETTECPDAGAGSGDFARIFGEIEDLDRASALVLGERAAATAAEIQKLRAGKKWRQSNS